MTAGSASTCPKSGLIVASRLKAAPRPRRRSTPVRAAVDDPSKKGFPSSARARRALLRTYGRTSTLLEGRVIRTPRSSPNWLTTPPLEPRDQAEVARLVVPLSLPAEVDPPGLERVRRLVADLREGDPDLHMEDYRILPLQNNQEVYL